MWRAGRRHHLLVPGRLSRPSATVRDRGSPRRFLLDPFLAARRIGSTGEGPSVPRGALTNPVFFFLLGAVRLVAPHCRDSRRQRHNPNYIGTDPIFMEDVCVWSSPRISWVGYGVPREMLVRFHVGRGPVGPGYSVDPVGMTCVCRLPDYHSGCGRGWVGIVVLPI